MRRLHALLVAGVLAASSPAGAQPLPAGHPAVGGAAAPPSAPEPDAVRPSPDAPPDTIVVRLVNGAGEPLPDTELKLAVQFQKIAEGEQRTERRSTTDANGVARFTKLTSGSEFSYRVSASSGPAEYTSDPIQLKGDVGAEVLLHVYPVTRNVEEAAVGAIVYVYVETRDDVFQFEVLARYGNGGQVSWVPEAARMRLPSGFKAFKAGESMTNARFVEDPGHGAKLAGTLSPGQHQVSFRFQLARHEEAEASFDFGLPPRVGEARFIAEAAPTMELSVGGFERPRTDVSQTGQRLLVTRRVAVRGESSGLGDFTVQLSGIPTPGPGRWIAALIATLLAGLGVAVFSGKLGRQTQAELHERDAARARRVLLNEVVALTQARREERIGPTTYESARRALVDALSRIVAHSPEPGTKASRPSPRRTGKKPARGAQA